MCNNSIHTSSFRHDHALQTLAKGIKELFSKPCMLIYVPGIQGSENSPALMARNFLITSAHPDMVLVGKDEVTLLELITRTPHNSMESMSQARDHKLEKELTSKLSVI